MANQMAVRGTLTTVLVKGVTRLVDKWRTGQREELITIFARAHLHREVHHYQGKIYAWDVETKRCNDDGSVRDTIWSDMIGPEYIDLAFQWAHEADPDAVLFYNEFGVEKSWREAGCPDQSCCQRGLNAVFPFMA